MTTGQRPVTAAGTEPQRGEVGWAGWVGWVLLCLSALASAVLELMFVPLYAGTSAIVIPVAVLVAVLLNLMLPRWAQELTASTRAAFAPVLVWIVVVVALSLYARPEGDLFVLGAYGEKWNFYALLLLGAAAGFVGVVRSAPRRILPTAPAAGGIRSR